MAWQDAFNKSLKPITLSTPKGVVSTAPVVDNEAYDKAKQDSYNNTTFDIGKFTDYTKNNKSNLYLTSQIKLAADDYGVFGGVSRSDMKRSREALGMDKQTYRNEMMKLILGDLFDANANYSRSDLKKARKTMGLSKSEFRNTYAKSLGQLAMNKQLANNSVYLGYSLKYNPVDIKNYTKPASTSGVTVETPITVGSANSEATLNFGPEHSDYLNSKWGLNFSSVWNKLTPLLKMDLAGEDGQLSWDELTGLISGGGASKGMFGAQSLNKLRTGLGGDTSNLNGLENGSDWYSGNSVRGKEGIESTNPFSSYSKGRLSAYNERGVNVNDSDVMSKLNNAGFTFDNKSQMLMHKGNDDKIYYYGQDGKVYSDNKHKVQVGTWNGYTGKGTDGASMLGYKALNTTPTNTWYQTAGLSGGKVGKDANSYTGSDGIVYTNTKNRIKYSRDFGHGLSRNGNYANGKYTGKKWMFNGKPIQGFKLNGLDVRLTNGNGSSGLVGYSIGNDGKLYLILLNGKKSVVNGATFYKQGGSLNKFQQGGSMQSDENSQEQMLTYATLGLIGYANANKKPMDFTTAIQQVMLLAESKPEVLQEIASNKELIQSGMQIMKSQEPEVLQTISQPGGLAKILLQIQQSQLTTMAKQGTKLNYIKHLKGICPEGYETVYMKAGGSIDGKMCPVCKKKKAALMENATGNEIPADKCGGKAKKHALGGVSELMNTIKADLYKCGGKSKIKKGEDGDKTPTKEELDKRNGAAEGDYSDERPVLPNGKSNPKYYKKHRFTYPSGDNIPTKMKEKPLLKAPWLK